MRVGRATLESNEKILFFDLCTAFVHHTVHLLNLSAFMWKTI